MSIVELPTNGDKRHAGIRWAAERIEAGKPVTGELVAAQFEVSARSGRNWLTAAKEDLAGRGKEVAAGPVPRVAPARVTGKAPAKSKKRVPTGMIAAAAAVALVAALISYVHIMSLALGVPPPRWLGYLAPVPLDGLVVVSTYAFVVTKTSTFVARCGIFVGFLGTLAMNVAAVWPGLVELQHVLAGLAAFVPIAVLAVGHIVLQAANER